MSLIHVKEVPKDLCANYELQSNEKLLSISIPSSNNPEGVGIVGIFTIPPTAFLSEKELIKTATSSESHYPPTHKLAIIAHGKGGHKNYCYQSILAQELSNKLGIYSFRFDFRGCGDSQDNEDSENGRTVKQDIEDYDLVLGVFESGKLYDAIGINLIPNAIIAHSRGAVSMFSWALEQQRKLDSGEKYRIMPNLVNAASRFNGRRLLDRLELKKGDDYLTQYRKGKYQRMKVPSAETRDLGSQDLSGIKDLDNEFQVLSIYGLADHIVPLEDSASFANLLNSRHTLSFIQDADHNFYGVTTIDSLEIANKWNIENLPLTKNLRINWNYKVVDLIIAWLHTSKDTSRFKDSTAAIYDYPRWKTIDGISNFRDIGGWRTKDNKSIVKPGLIYRCANPSNVTEKGKNQLRELGVKSFFDFRSSAEFIKNGGLEVEGIKINNIPVYKSVDISPQALALRYSNLLSSWYTFKYVYRDILHNGLASFSAVFRHLLERPNEPLVFNCQAGKDRTGVMAMLILLLLGVDNHTIAKEYELTTVGLIPDHPKIRGEFLQILKGLNQTVNESDRSKDRSEAFEDHPALKLKPEEMFQNLISSKYESMITAIDMFNTDFGGIEKYLIQNLGFTLEEVKKIRENLLIDSYEPIVGASSGQQTWKHRVPKQSLL